MLRQLRWSAVTCRSTAVGRRSPSSCGDDAPHTADSHATTTISIQDIQELLHYSQSAATSLRPIVLTSTVTNKQTNKTESSRLLEDVDLIFTAKVS